MRKKCLFYILLAVLVAVLCACGPGIPTQPDPSSGIQEGTLPQPGEDTLPGDGEGTKPAEGDPTTQPEAVGLPEGVTLMGIDLAGLEAEQALIRLRDGLESFALTFTYGKLQTGLSARELGLTLDEAAIRAYLTALEKGEAAPGAPLASFDGTSAQKALEEKLSAKVQNAAVRYTSTEKAFIIEPDKAGREVDAGRAIPALEAAVGALQAQCKGNLKVTELLPQITRDDPRLSAAVELANSYLDTVIAVTYKTTGIDPTRVALSRGELAKFLTVDKEFQVGLNREEIDQYATKMAQKYKGPAKKGDFRTTKGNLVNHQVTYYGAALDVEKLAQLLETAFWEKTGGELTAPYLPAITGQPYGGNYVEIDLTSQTLWCYKGGRCVISTPLVSGNASSHAYTPTGVFKVYSKSRDVWLSGRTFRDFVHYWIPFNRNIGMHDAMWRDEFGDEIYRYNGSHGCVNLPLSAAKVVYENVSVGTQVIVYGGRRSGSFTQELTGPEAMELVRGTEPVRLPFEKKYKGTEITFRSADKSVVTVDEEGFLTPVGEGSTTVTVTSLAVGSMKKATLQVQVTVVSPCRDGHSVSHWTAPEVACQPGVMTGLCDGCGQEQQMEYVPVQHDFSGGGSHCGYGCGTENPEYVAPEPPEGGAEETEPEGSTEPEGDEE